MTHFHSLLSLYILTSLRSLRDVTRKEYDQKCEKFRTLKYWDFCTGNIVIYEIPTLNHEEVTWPFAQCFAIASTGLHAADQVIGSPSPSLCISLNLTRAQTEKKGSPIMHLGLNAFQRHQHSHVMQRYDLNIYVYCLKIRYPIFQHLSTWLIFRLQAVLRHRIAMHSLYIA